MVAKRPLTTTTQNTQQLTEPLLLPYLPAALSSHSMGRSAAPTTHGAAASHGSMLGACGLVWWCHCWLACLEGVKHHTSKIERKWCLGLNSLTPQSVLAGTKNSRSKRFWLAKHKHTTIPTMMEPFPPPAPWF